MRKVVGSFISLLLLINVAAAAPSDDAIAFVNLLSAQKYQDAFAHLDDRMKQGLPAAKLGSVWQGVLDKLGAFKRTDVTKTEEAQGYTVVYVKGVFERGAIWVQVAYDKNNEIAGLHFLPVS